MPDDSQGNTPEETALRFTSAFASISEMIPDYLDVVVGRALDSRNQVSTQAQRELQLVIRDTVRVAGFQNADRALSTVLRGPVSRSVLNSNRLAGAVLKVWAESHKTLLDIVTEHLRGMGIPDEYPDFSKERFRDFWPDDSWERESDRLLEIHSELSEADVALMLCYVSGKMPNPSAPSMNDDQGNDDREDEVSIEVSSNDAFFSQWLERLRDLPAGAAEWEQARNFIASATEIIEAKESERNQAARLEAVITEIRDEFSEVLAFFQRDAAPWYAGRLSSASIIAEALETVSELKSLLAEYRSVLERAPVITEEMARREKRAELESRILPIMDRVDLLMAGAQRPEDDPPPSGLLSSQERPEDGPAGQPDRTDQPQLRGGPPDDSPSLAEAHDGYDELSLLGTEAGEQQPTNQQPANEQSSGHNDRPEGADPESDESSGPEDHHPEDPIVGGLAHNTSTANEQAAEERTFLDEEYIELLNLEKEDLEEKVQSLESGLRDSQGMEKYWRLAYQAERSKSADVGEDAPSPIESVGHAVGLASERFTGKLLFRLNSKSVVEANPFEDPEAVRDALKWLATDYYQSRVGELSVPDFDRSIRETCGWWYKGNQRELTVNKYREWYTTKVDGRTYQLDEHIGKGTNKDARHTIRIAFDWDRDRRMVIIGFIGQHQQTDAT